MKRLGGWLALLVVLGVGAWGARVYAAKYAVAVERAEQAKRESRAHEAVARAQQDTANQLRAERDRYRLATDAATRKATETARRASNAVRTALDAVSDTSATLEDLRGVIRHMAAAWTADSLANAEREAAWLRRGLAYEAVIQADSVALWTAWDAYAAKERELSAVKAIPRRGFLANLASLACTVALTGASAEVGSKVYPEGGAALGGGAGYLASRAVCR